MSSVEWAVLSSLIAAAVVLIVFQLGLEVQAMYQLLRACIINPSACP